MKKNKWFNWKVGAAASLGFALLFHEVKASDLFKKVVAEYISFDGNTASAAQQDKDLVVIDESTWQSFFKDNAAGQSSTANPNNGQGNLSTHSTVTTNSTYTRIGGS